MIRCFGISILFLLSTGIAVGQKGYQIKIQLKNIKRGELYLGNYYGQNTYLSDTAKISETGNVVFEGEKKLPGGIYFILYPSQKRYFEFLVGKKQHFSIFADSSNHFKDLRFRNSPVNQSFRKYNQFVRARHQEIIQAKRNKKDSIAVAHLQKEEEKKIKSYREKRIERQPQTVLATLFRGMMMPTVPDKYKKSQEDAYYYTRKHFWDRFNFSDSSIVRSPILETRLKRYFHQQIPRNPDSVNLAADELLKKAEANKEVFKFMLWWLTSNYERSRYMGMDAVFVHLVEKYYATGKAYWIKKEQLQRIIGKAAKIAPNLIGNIAPELTLKTPNLKTRKLSEVDAKYIVLTFWDPSCGHCKVTIPKLDSVYEKHWRKRNVKIVGVLAGGKKKQWISFIKKHHLEDWINLWDPENKSSYRRMYDVYQTPIIYLLDKHKKIIAKHLSVEQLTHFLQNVHQKDTSS